MSTGLIIAIVIIAIALLAFFVLLPRLRDRARVKARERELDERRERVATEHRTEAGAREREAEVAERQARMARKEAEQRRAEAELHQERASMHEQGMADEELVEEHERERFAGTSMEEPAKDTDTSRTGGRIRSGTTDGEERRGEGRFTRSADQPGVDEPVGERRTS